jgi:predicted CXXCH cytochrome family protein
MRCLLLTVTRNRRGEPVKDGRVVEADELRIGRNSACEIHLPDPRVRLHHASLSQNADHRLVLEVVGDPIEINGAMARSAHLRPGTKFHIGPYLCQIELPIPEGFDQHDFVLSVERVELAAPRTRESRRVPMSLKEAGFSPWRAALFALLLALICLWVIPRLGDFAPRAAVAADSIPAAKALRVAWTAGPLDAGHRSFGNDCTACHDAPFQPVSDEKCMGCHENAMPHVRDIALRNSAPEGRCASCHRDHRGLQGMTMQAPGLCTDCHANIRGKYPKTSLRDVSDFATGHPGFRLDVHPAASSTIEHVEQTGMLQQINYTGLKFPHDVHLAAGGVAAPSVKPGQTAVTNAKGTRIEMHCADCHVASPTGVGFQPVSMKESCSQCHRLEFQPGNARQLPHGSVEEVMATLKDFYAAAALGAEPIKFASDAGMTRDVHPVSSAGTSHIGSTLASATGAADAAAKEVFTVRVCVTCHVVTPTGDAALPYKIQPVAGEQHWMPQSHFEHARHAAVECTTCHTVTKLKNVETVAMPTLETCRTCHVGATPVAGKVTSGCAMCHDYHTHPNGQAMLEQTALAEPLATGMPARPVKTGALSNTLENK